jgi:glycosyltransferase involved in cell wall biosynthesis
VSWNAAVRAKRRRASSADPAQPRVVAYRQPSHFGGMGVVADTFLPWLSELGVELDTRILTAPGRPLSKMGKLAPQSVRHGLRLAGGAVKTVISDRPDLCYFPIAQYGPALIRDVALVLIFRATGVRCLVHLHGSLLQQRFSRPVKGAVFRVLLPHDRWIVLSPAIAASFPSGWSTVVVRNPLPAEVETRPAGRRRAGDPLKVGWLGAIAKEKGVDMLLSAASDLPGVELTLAGEWGDMPTDRGSARYVGMLDRKAALAYWADEDVCLLPSRVREGLPMTILEALQAGAFVGATSSLGLRDLMDAGALEEIEPSYDSIRTVLESLWDVETLDRRLERQQAAWHATRDQFDREHVRREFQEVVSSMLSSGDQEHRGASRSRPGIAMPARGRPASAAEGNSSHQAHVDRLFSGKASSWARKYLDDDAFRSRFRVVGRIVREELWRARVQ